MQRRRNKRNQKVREKLNFRASFIDSTLKEFFNTEDAKEKMKILKSQYKGIQVLTLSKPRFSWKFFFQTPTKDLSPRPEMLCQNSFSRLQNAGKLVVSDHKFIEDPAKRNEVPSLEGLPFAINGAGIILKPYN